MGLLPEYKYEHEGGPGFVQCIELLRGVSAKAWDSPRAGTVPFLLLFPFKLAPFYTVPGILEGSRPWSGAFHISYSLSNDQKSALEQLISRDNPQS